MMLRKYKYVKTCKVFSLLFNFRTYHFSNVKLISVFFEELNLSKDPFFIRK